MAGFLYGICCFSLVSFSFAFAADTFAKQALHTTLANGLHVTIKEDHRAPLAMIQVWYRVGAVDEPKDKLGISHVLEHMMFKGSIRVPNGELKQINQRFGGSLNAFTTPNNTYYYQLYPKEYLGLGLELEADRMSGLYLQQKDLATEIKVVMEERLQRVEDNPQALAFEKFRYAAYPLSAYQSPVIGHMENLNNIHLTDLQQWYQQWYAPNNAHVVIVGDVDADTALQQVQRFFGDIPAKTLSPPPVLTHPINLGYRHVEFDHPTDVPNVYLAWNVPSLKTAQHPTQAYSLLLLKNYLTGNLSSKLYVELVQKRKILTALSVNYDFVQRGDTLFTITAIPQKNISLANAEKTILALMEELSHTLISAEDLQQVKTNTIAELIYTQDSLNGQAKGLGALAANELESYLTTDFKAEYQQVSAEQIRSVVQNYFNKNNLTSLYLQSKQYKQSTHLTEDLPTIDNISPPTVPEQNSNQER